MNQITFRPAVREGVWGLVAFVGSSGSGKTYSAMEFATGMTSGERFAVIDTENGRARHYADMFDFDVADLRAPFRPEAYADAIESAAKAGYKVIVVDSFSHEHAGDGGLLDWHEEEFQRMGGRESAKMAAWIKPKMAHKRMMTRLLQVNAHVIVCLRAEEKVDIVRDANGKTQIVPKKSLTGLDGWVPICEKNLPYEMTMSLLLTADAPGVPKPIKLQQQHRQFLPLDRPIGRSAGAAFAAWAAGAGPDPEGTPVPASVKGDNGVADAGEPAASREQKLELVQLAESLGVTPESLKAIVAQVTGSPSLRSSFPASKVAEIADMIALEVAS